MAHHLVRYVWHVRKELERVLEGLSEKDCEKAVLNMHSVAWMVGHLAMQEQAYWFLLQEKAVFYPELAAYRGVFEGEAFFAENKAKWQEVTAQSNTFLESLSPQDLAATMPKAKENTGSLLTRVIGHYYFHIGQITVIRRHLGLEIPSFVGSQEGAYYQSE